MKHLALKAAGRRREPLRTLTELAGELGISVVALGRALKEPGAPPPIFDGEKLRHTSRVKWFTPSEVRAWWRGRSI